MSATVAAQFNRLKLRFGDKAFDDEFVKLVYPELMGLSEHALIRLIDVFIGNRPTNRPPMLDDFRQARLIEEKRKFDEDARGASSAMNRSWPGGLKVFLAKNYPGCKTLNEAVAVRRLQIQLRRADDPNYNPLV